MRRFHWLLISCLALVGSRAFAFEFFGDALYWQATEPVDWTMNTNGSTPDQFVAFRSLDFDFATGFRVGAGLDREWGAKFYYTRYSTVGEDAVTGDVTPNFLGSRLNMPTHYSPYYQSGSIRGSIDYNVLDLDFGRSCSLSESWELRPVLGLRGAWINQAFDTEFQGRWSPTEWATSREHIDNDFWGIGPKLGVENALILCRGERWKLDLTMNFHSAYLLGFWTIKDSALNATDQGETTQVVPIDNRHFGALMFQAMIGLHLNYGGWDVTTGYEINDWLNQCQIFDDATGPHNNDLIVQGLCMRVSRRF
jgi:hypothetical protein